MERKTTQTIKKRQHKTKAHKIHSVQVLLPWLDSVPCIRLGGSLYSSSSCLYLSSAALSLAICSARSLNFTVSNCQGPALFGGIGIEEGAVESRQDRDRNEENDSADRKGRFQIAEVSLCKLYGLRKGGGAFGNLFLGPSTAWLNILIQYIVT